VYFLGLWYFRPYCDFAQSVEGPMQSTYEAFEFNVRLGYPGGATLHLRVHAPDRARAWERVRQMHPRAVDAAVGRAEASDPREAQTGNRSDFSK
jgi:hypothetical protein